MELTVKDVIKALQKVDENKKLYQRVKDLEYENKRMLLLVNKKGLN